MRILFLPSYLYDMKRALLLLFFSIKTCFAQTTVSPLTQGIWRAELQINDTFRYPSILSTSEGLEIMNGRERLPVNEYSLVGDTLVIRFPVFDAEVRCRYTADSLNGFFLNHARKTQNVVPFRAAAGQDFDSRIVPNVLSRISAEDGR